jgi:hypothetical protein
MSTAAIVAIAITATGILMILLQQAMAGKVQHCDHEPHYKPIRRMASELWQHSHTWGSHNSAPDPRETVLQQQTQNQLRILKTR